MAKTSSAGGAERPAGIAGIWPWPGNFFLVLFAVWLFYMGSMAELQDVKTAFYGLGCVTLFVLLFGLRSAAKARINRPALDKEERRRQRRERRRQTASLHARRSAIPDAGRGEGLVFPDDPSPQSRLHPSGDAAPNGTADAGEALPYSDSTDAGAARSERPPIVAEPLPERKGAAESDPARSGGVENILRQLEARINRERAERGAQIAKLESALREEIRALKSGGGVASEAGEAGDGGEVRASLSARIDELANRVDAIGAGAGDPSPSDNILRVTSINSHILPRVGQMIDKRIAIALDPAALREKILEALPATTAHVGEDGDGTLGDRVVAAHAALEAANEASRTEREQIRAQIDKLQRSVQRALGTAMTARRAVGEAEESEVPVLEQLAALREEMGRLREGGGDVPHAGRIAEIETTVAERFSEIGGAIDELRANLAMMTDHVARMGEHHRDLLGRLERVGDSLPASAPPPATGGNVQSEVEALRDALTTIIEQNREIRAQQDALSSRLDPSARAER